VETAAFTVEVTGTRFLVDLARDGGEAEVIVSEGTVDVRGESIGNHRLRPKEALDIGAEATVRPAAAGALAALDALFPEPVPSTNASFQTDMAAPRDEAAIDGAGAGSPAKGGGNGPAGVSPAVSGASGPDVRGLVTWRGWVIEGRLDEARYALRDHLGADPSDVAAWSLLADCERKLSHWPEAVAAYERLTALSGGEEANRARFKAAVIVQDRLADHERAVPLLEEFLAQGDDGSLLADRAKIRLSGSLIALGRTERAAEHLLAVTKTSGDEAIRSEARQLLDQLEGE
jgi:hypothetical protein